MKKSKRLFSCCLGILLLFVFSLSSVQSYEISKVEAATAAPVTTITKKTLYVGYENYTIKFKNLESKATVTYKTNDNEIASVTEKGVIRPVAMGSATITVSIRQNSRSYTNSIEVTVKKPFIAIINSTNELNQGDTFTFTAQAKGIKNASIEWTASNTKVAAIGKTSGNLTAKAVGKVTLTAMDSDSGKNASVTLTVKAKGKPTVTPKAKATSIPTPKATATPIPKATVTPTPVVTVTTVPLVTIAPTPIFESPPYIPAAPPYIPPAPPYIPPTPPYIPPAPPIATPTPIPTATPTPIPTATPTPIPTATPTPGLTMQNNIIYQSVFSTGFEEGTSGFTGRSSGNIVKVTNSTANTGIYSLQTSNRTNTWHGPILDMTGTMLAGKTYQVTAWVKYNSSAANLKIQCSIDKNNGSTYIPIGSVSAVKDTWTKLECSIFITNDTSSVKLYFEAPDSATDDIYIDDINLSVATVNMEKIQSIPSIAKAFKDYFDIGAALSGRILYSDPTNVLVLHQFSTITFDGEMKPEYLLDHATSISNLNTYNLSPSINTNKMKEYLQYAMDNGLKVRFHTLVWHQQTPRWFFAVDYSTDPAASLVTKEVMLTRLENYIKQVMACASNYPGVIYAWDVVNEAIESSHNMPNGYRATDSLWYQIIGEEYVEKAFEYARKYSYDTAPLFYNDYNTYQLTKRTAIFNMVSMLKGKGLIDGIGMQSHIDMGYPTLSDYEAAVRKFAELGLEINITELDMHNNQNTAAALEQQAIRYGDLFEILTRLKVQGIANITNVTFWGILDSDSWLTNHRGETSYPLLFDKYAEPKAAFYKLIDLVK